MVNDVNLVGGIEADSAGGTVSGRQLVRGHSEKLQLVENGG